MNNNFTVIKSTVAASRGLVFGWGQISQNGDGSPHYDTDNQTFDDNDMLIDSWLDFMESGGQLNCNHDSQQIGKVVFAFPVTPDIADSLGLTCPQYGVIVGAKITDPTTQQAYASGQLSGFSVGGFSKWANVSKMRFDGQSTKQRAVKFALKELSIVDNPAQLPALITLAKSQCVDVTEILAKQRQDAADLFEKHADMIQTEKKCSRSDAYRELSHTEHGAALYAISTCKL